MAKYIYTGSSNLAFTHAGKDYLAYGAGPHELPEDAGIVLMLEEKGLLTKAESIDTKAQDIPAKTKAKKTTIFKN